MDLLDKTKLLEWLEAVQMNASRMALECKTDKAVQIYAQAAAFDMVIAVILADNFDVGVGSDTVQ